MRVVLVGLFLCGTGLTLPVLMDPGPLLLDASLLHALEVVRTNGVTNFAILLTGVGGNRIMVPLCTLIVGVFALRDPRASVFLAMAWVGSAISNELMKILINRPRPTFVHMLTSPRGLSFPSGHSQATMAFALGLVVVLHRANLAPVRRSIWLLLIPFAVGSTRAYLGVHYPTDILAGWCFGAAAVLLTHELFPPRVAEISTT